MRRPIRRIVRCMLFGWNGLKKSCKIFATKEKLLVNKWYTIGNQSITHSFIIFDQWSNTHLFQNIENKTKNMKLKKKKRKKTIKGNQNTYGQRGGRSLISNKAYNKVVEKIWVEILAEVMGMIHLIHHHKSALQFSMRSPVVNAFNSSRGTIITL